METFEDNEKVNMTNVHDEQNEYDIAKFSECRPVYYSPKNVRLEETHDDVSSDAMSADMSGNIIDSSGNSIITFKKIHL